jgi:thiol peroxidase
MDLPFAQARWCGAAGIEKVITLSDHQNAAFGKEYGVLIKEFRLLARSVFILDQEGVIRYTQLVKEIGDEPDYDEILDAARKVISN